MQRSETKRGSYLIAVLLIGFFWYIFSVAVNSPSFPNPGVVFNALVTHLREGLLEHFLVSTYRVIYAIMLALSLAVPAGLMSFEKRIDRFVAPFLYLLYPIPHIVLLPLIILLFGIGDVSKIVLIAMIIFFQILVTTRDAARNVSEYYVYSMLSMGATRKDVYKHVIFPASLPKILTAMRISIGTSIAILFFAESFATTKGLGYIIMDSWSKADYPGLYAGILSMAILGFSLYIILEYIEKRVCKWV